MWIDSLIDAILVWYPMFFLVFVETQRFGVLGRGGGNGGKRGGGAFPQLYFAGIEKRTETERRQYTVHAPL